MTGRTIKTSKRRGKASRAAIVKAVRKVKADEYPYDLGEKIIAKYFPDEVKQGGIIEFEFTDCGTLHSMLAAFYEALKNSP
ncbi:MAG: hypothetical protein V3V81_07480 [Candidatus Bathyarchaeia archaeon]